jgi:hypothetical protein
VLQGIPVQHLCRDYSCQEQHWNSSRFKHGFAHNTSIHPFEGKAILCYFIRIYAIKFACMRCACQLPIHKICVEEDIFHRRCVLPNVGSATLTICNSASRCLRPESQPPINSSHAVCPFTRTKCQHIGLRRQFPRSACEKLTSGRVAV